MANQPMGSLLNTRRYKLASFTDNPNALSNFSPYVQVLPTEAMSQVGIIKQQMFDQGVEKIQSTVDALSSLPIAKEEVKGYVQTKLGQLKEGVTRNIAGDFSDMRVINQIGGAARIIAKDPIVQNGVTSTAKMQTSLSELQEAKKAGKSAPQNEAHLQNSISGWLNDGQLDSQFTGSYTPYTDITDRFIKLYKEQNPGEDIPQDAYRTDANGNTVINPVLFKGKGPAKIQALFNVVASQPDVRQQLNIDGWYKFRGTTTNQLGVHLAENANATLKSIESAVQALQVKLATGSTDNTLSTQIEQLKQLAVEKKKSFEGVAGMLRSNPEAAKAQIVKEELGSNLIHAYSYQTMEKSPLWETSMQQKIFDREYFEWQQTYNQNERKFQWDMINDRAKLEMEASKASKAAKGTPGSSDIITEGPIVTSEIPLGSEKATADVNATFDEYSQAQMELMSRLSGGNPSSSPTVLDNVTGKWKFNFGPDRQYKSLTEAQKALQTMLPLAKDKYINGTVEDSRTQELLDKVQIKQDNWKSKKQIVDDVEAVWGTKLADIKGKIGNEDFANAYIVEQRLPGWENVKKSLQAKYGENWTRGMGITDAPGDPVPQQYTKNLPAYRKATAELRKDATIAPALQQREEAYRRRQQTSIPLVVTHDVSTGETRDATNTRFNALLSSLALNPSTGKGDINAALALTDKSAKKYNANQYRSGIDPQTGRAYISIQAGDDEPVTVEITRAEYQRQFPERNVNVEFREKYGPRFNQTQETSTDPLGDANGGGRANAYVAKQPKESPYIVQYHLNKEGANQYNIKWWVSAKQSPDTPLINGENASGTVVGMPSTLTEEQVVEWTKKFQDKNWLEQVVLLKFMQKK